eukprot:CAMPEP_0173370172 /NCGR_PEP_ID=MMETSP1144-20121109/26536_1 /TAXON_ID=483371 /ORGANISM="non described non described, Strain CCMP2298" /LENGTH=41 /DNA_ID= /DNA_START= /DNA_END= /DNA_ORIENTATION=
MRTDGVLLRDSYSTSPIVVATLHEVVNVSAFSAHGDIVTPE